MRAAYFDVLDDMILHNKNAFFFRGRSRRPPLDAFNALLSFAYSLLAHDCASALESVAWTPMWAFCTGIVREEPLWPWI